MKQIPKIRFSQFDDKWSLTAIGNLAQIKRGASPRPIQDPKWFDKNSDIGWLRISDVTEQNGRIKYLEQKISKLGQEKTRVLSTPHLLLSIAATVGKPVVNYVKTGVHDGFLIFVNPKFDREFMFQWFDMFRPKWNKYGQPGSQVNLNSDIIRNHKMMIPSLPEQSAIGSLFRTLDDLLASYKNNLANYQSLKATMLSKMFPKAGQIVPEIRLDGFEGEWKFSSLGEQADITKLAGFEFTNHVVYSDEGQIPAIRGLNVKNQKVNLSDVKYIDKSDFSKLDRSKLIEDDLLFTYVGTVGEVARVPESVLWYLAPNVSRIRLNRTLDSRFVLYQMASNRFKQKQIFPLIATSSQPALSMTNIRKFIISSTTLEEQQAIGSYFSNLDNLITSHQEKISQLETLKNKLLQDMFI